MLFVVCVCACVCGGQLSRRAMQRMTQRLLRKLTTLGQYEESLVTTSGPATEKLTAQKAKQQAARKEDVLSVCSDPFILAQQLTHIEMVSGTNNERTNRAILSTSSQLVIVSSLKLALFAHTIRDLPFPVACLQHSVPLESTLQFQFHAHSTWIPLSRRSLPV